MSIWIRRAYEAPTRNDGYRILEDRVWPCGVSKEDLEIDEWDHDLAPTTKLRRWFDHDPEKWEEFQPRYFDEPQEKASSIRPLLDRIRRGWVTLVFGARDTQHNQAVALRSLLENSASRRDRNANHGGSERRECCRQRIGLIWPWESPGATRKPRLSARRAERTRLERFGSSDRSDAGSRRRASPRTRPSRPAGRARHHL